MKHLNDLAESANVNVCLWVSQAGNQDKEKEIDQVGIGVIGCGRMGARYAADVAFRMAHARLIVVSDVDEGLAKKTATSCGISEYSTDYHELLENDKIRGIIIASSTHTHVEIIKDAAEAGKHMFCEKPITLSLEGTDAVIEAVEKAGVKFQLGFMRRFDSGYVEAKRRIERGEIGDPVLFKGISRDIQAPPLEYAKPSVSGGIIMDLSIHDFDLARWLMGSEVTRVYAEKGVLVHRQLESIGASDTCLVNLAFENGAMGSVETSRYAVYGYVVRTEVIGEKGSIIIDQDRYSPVTLFRREFTGISHETVPWFLERFAPAYFNQVKDFVDNLFEGGEPRVSARDGKAALKVVLAATQSAREERPVRV